MKKNKTNIKTQVQSLRLRKDDVLVVKFPVDEQGYTMHDYDALNIYYKAITEKVKNNLLFLPSDFDFLRIRKEVDEVSNAKRRSGRKFIKQ